MRLLNTTTLELKEFHNDDDLPIYAILSHRWGNEEVLFQDIQDGTAPQKLGYEKLDGACQLAASDGFEHIWIDTCCIDKRSSSELSESINSMYRYYEESTVCYAYLSDVAGDSGITSGEIEKLLSSNSVQLVYDSQSGWSVACGRDGYPVRETTAEPDDEFAEVIADFSRSQWFTRGWTLQELIAPSTVIFLDQYWREIGTKLGLRQAISQITRIPEEVLQGAALENYSIAQKMSWASRRTTTKVEDLAYCLLGLFGINMPMLYGEGARAFARLQEEIIKISDDHSIFAWSRHDVGSKLGESMDVLATSPSLFWDSSDIVPSDTMVGLAGTITTTNKGIHLECAIARLEAFDLHVALLPCSTKGSPQPIGIYLQSVHQDYPYFRRAKNAWSFRLHPATLSRLSSQRTETETLTKICIQRCRQARPRQPTLAKAEQYENWKVVDLLLNKTVRAEAKHKHGDTELAWAIRSKAGKVAQHLIIMGADPNELGQNGDVPLCLAIQCGLPELAAFLLQHGASPHAPPQSTSRQPLILAMEKRDWRLAKELLAKGADPNGVYWQFPLISAIRAREEDLIRMFLEEGYDLNHMTIPHPNGAAGPAMLVTAVHENAPFVAELLMKYGVDPNAKWNGVSALEEARIQGDQHMVDCLLGIGNWKGREISDYDIRHRRRARTVRPIPMVDGRMKSPP